LTFYPKLNYFRASHTCHILPTLIKLNTLYSSMFFTEPVTPTIIPFWEINNWRKSVTMNIRVSPQACPALVLNADFRPLSYYPLSLWNWQDAIKAVFLDRVNIIAEYEHEVCSPSFSMKLPSVVGLKEYVKPSKAPAFTRFNVFLRDQFSCQYCGSKNDLTFDHVIPRSKGGQTTWENVITACSPCNLKKSNKMPSQAKMHPFNKPYKPSAHDLNNNGRKFPPNYLHESWTDFLYWDTELEA